MQTVFPCRLAVIPEFGGEQPHPLFHERRDKGGKIHPSLPIKEVAENPLFGFLQMSGSDVAPPDPNIPGNVGRRVGEVPHIRVNL